MKIDTYIEEVVSQSTFIQEIIGSVPEEYAYTLLTKKGIKYPLFRMMPTRQRVDGNAQRTWIESRISFDILDIKPEGFEESKAILDRIEEDGLEIYRKIYRDVHSSGKWHHISMDKNTFSYAEVEYENLDRIAGINFSFNIREPNTIQYNPELWNGNKPKAFSSGYSKAFR